MRRLARLIALLCATATNAAPAAVLPPGQAQAIRQEFLARQQQTRTWSAGFKQTLAMPGMRQTIVSSGRIIYRTPGQLRLDFTQPAGEFVLIVGDGVYLQKAGEALERLSLAEDFAAKPFASLLAFLAGHTADDDTWYALEIAQSNGRYRVVLTRRADAPEELPPRITNVLDQPSLEVREVSVELPSGGTLHYRFDGAVRNQPVDGTRFMPPDPR